MSGSQIVSKGITDLAVTTAKIANTAVDASKLASDAVTTAKILADAVTGAKIRLDNNQAIRARNAANAADVSLIKLDASDIAQLLVQFRSAFTPSNANDVANKAYVDSAAGGTHAKEVFVLSGTNITNQYLDLAQVAKTDSIQMSVLGLLPQIEGASYSYSVNYTGGVGSKSRISFLNGLATGGGEELVAGDIVELSYTY